MSNEINKEWKDMPEYDNIHIDVVEIEAKFKFRNKEDFDIFHKFIKEGLYNNKRVFDGMQKKDKKSAWFPPKEKASKYRYENES